jgi:acetyl esterase
MPIDPEFLSILDSLNGLPEPDYSRPALELAREMRATPVHIPPLLHAVAVEVRNVPGFNGDPIRVRIYRPLTQQPQAALLSLHGGGWVTGGLDSDEFKCHLLAHWTGCAIVSVDYRLAPEHPYPTPAEDCYAVTQWTAANAAALRLDAGRIGIAGSSAGGNLAACVAMMARDRRGPALRCQLLTYPVCDHDFDRPSYLMHAEGKLLSRRQMMWFWDQYAAGVDRNHGYLSPARADDLTGLPPALVITAEFDPLCDEGEDYARRLADAGNEASLVRSQGMVHGFLAVAVQHRKSMEALRVTADAMQRYLG